MVPSPQPCTINPSASVRSPPGTLTARLLPSPARPTPPQPPLTHPPSPTPARGPPAPQLPPDAHDPPPKPPQRPAPAAPPPTGSRLASATSPEPPGRPQPQLAATSPSAPAAGSHDPEHSPNDRATRPEQHEPQTPDAQLPSWQHLVLLGVVFPTLGQRGPAGHDLPAERHRAFPSTLAERSLQARCTIQRACPLMAALARLPPDRTQPPPNLTLNLDPHLGQVARIP